MKTKKKEMILQAWESLEIKEEAEEVYGKPVPLNRKAARCIGYFLQDKTSYEDAWSNNDFVSTLLRLFQLQLLYLIRVDSLCGGGQSEIGESIFGNSLCKHGKQRKKVKAVRSGRKNKLAHKPSVQNLLNGNLVLPDKGFNRSGLKGLRKLVRKSCRVGKL